MRLFSNGGWVLGLVLVLVAACPADSPPPVRAPVAPVAAVAPPPAPAPAAAAISCRPEPAQPVAVESGRTVHCAIDVGSRNVKLVVVSLVDSRAATLQNERQCRLRLQLADKTTDPATGTPRPLSTTDQSALATLFGGYLKQCEADGGRMHGAIATEWARRAPNGPEVKRALEQETGVRMDILDRAAEARYAYLSATRGTPGKLVLDFGSRSVQLSFWPRGLKAPEGISVPIGIDEAGDRYFGAPTVHSYTEGRRALEPILRAALAPVLASARASLKKKNLAPELFSLGENGDLALALTGKLWKGSPLAAVDEAGYGAAVKAHVRETDPRYGPVTAVLPTSTVLELERTLDENPALFEQLRDPGLRRVYGNKMLVYPVIARLLARELGIATIVLVPQEMADGFLIERLTPSPAASPSRVAAP